MVNIFHNIYNASCEYNMPGDLAAGANIAGFQKVADVMLAQGVI
jgi:glutamate dehydrogenase (NADP+)